MLPVVPVVTVMISVFVLPKFEAIAKDMEGRGLSSDFRPTARRSLN